MAPPRRTIPKKSDRQISVLHRATAELPRPRVPGWSQARRKRAAAVEQYASGSHHRQRSVLEQATATPPRKKTSLLERFQEPESPCRDERTAPKRTSVLESATATPPRREKRAAPKNDEIEYPDIEEADCAKEGKNTIAILFAKDGSRRFVAELSDKSLMISTMSRIELKDCSMDDMVKSLVKTDDDPHQMTAAAATEGLTLAQAKLLGATRGGNGYITMPLPIMGTKAEGNRIPVGNCVQCFRMGVFPFECVECTKPIRMVSNVVGQVLHPLLVTQLFGKGKDGLATVGRPVSKAVLEEAGILSNVSNWLSKCKHLPEQDGMVKPIRDYGAINWPATQLLHDLKERIHKGKWDQICGKAKCLLYMLHVRGKVLLEGSMEKPWDIFAAGSVHPHACVVATDRKTRCIYQVVEGGNDGDGGEILMNDEEIII